MDNLSRILSNTNSGIHFGLKEILSDYEEVNENNIIDILDKAKSDIEENRYAILELKEFYKGKQPILYRVNNKSEINEKININILPAVTSTLAGLWLGEKVDYVLNAELDDTLLEEKRKDISIINKQLRYLGDILCDKYSLTDMLISGVAYQFCGGDTKNGELVPKLCEVKSENCFTIRKTTIGNDILLTGIYSEINGEVIYTCYSDDYKFIVRRKGTESSCEKVAHYLPHNPLQEIKLNDYYLSMVAQLESCQNALNLTISDTINNLIGQVRSLLLITGGELTKENVEKAKASGVLNVVAQDGRNVTGSFLKNSIDESVSKIRQEILDIVYMIAGLPSVGSSTSGNNGAVFYGSGFYTANQNAYFNELEFKKPKQRLIDNLIEVLRMKSIIKSDISSYDIEIRFDRTRLSSLLDNANALSVLLASGMPIKDSIKVCGIFNDVDRVAAEAEKILEEKVNAEIEKISKENEEKQLKNEEKTDKTIDNTSATNGNIDIE